VDAFTLSKSRFEAFSDGVFAVAITLLALEFHLPPYPDQGSPPEAWQVSTLLAIWPQYVAYGASFVTIGIMWLNHHAQFRYIEKITHGIVIANLLLLLFICFLPFPTEVLGRLGFTRTAVVYYGLAISLIAFGYTILQEQIVVAHGAAIRRTFTIWNAVGIFAYPVATLVGYFYPAAGVTLYVLLALFYMLPSNVRQAAFRPEPPQAP